MAKSIIYNDEAYRALEKGLRNLAAGANPIALKRGIDEATEYLVGKVAEHSKPVGDSKAIAQVGAIYAGKDEEVSAMIAQVMDKVGKEGLTGAMIVSRALTAPLKRIAENAGQNGAVIA